MGTGRLLLELGSVLLGLGIVSLLAGRIGLSPIPLYLLAGLSFGRGGIAPLHAPESFFSTGSEVGVVLLLLVLGLEYTATDLVANLRRQAGVGVLDIAINGAPGVVLALVLGWGGKGALVMFGVTAVSSSGIASKMMSELHDAGAAARPGVLSILVLEDLSMATYLPVVTAVLAASGALVAARSVAVALATLVVVLVLALRYGDAFSRLVTIHSNEALLLRVVGLALVVAGGAEEAHVSAAVGAFLLGIALSGDLARLLRSLLEPLRDMFAAVFFVFFGLSTNPSDLPKALPAAAVLTVVGVGTKLATGWLAGRRQHLCGRDRLLAGVLLIARGEFSIVIAGLTAKVVDPTLAPTAAAFVLMTAVIGPVAMRFVRGSQRGAPPPMRPSPPDR